MKKIIAALDPMDNPWPVITFAVHLARNNATAIQLVFLALPEGVDYDYPFPNDLSAAEDYFGAQSISGSNAQLIEDKTRLFKYESETAQINFIAEKGITVTDLIKKSQDAGILVADRGASFLAKVLPHLSCPALIAGEDHLPEKVILLFNGTHKSQIAIESYLTLKTQFQNLPTYLISINPGEERENENYLDKLKPFFSDISYKALHGNEQKQLDNFLSGLSGSILVIMGAFGRSEISGFFHKSLTNAGQNEKGVSLLIYHHSMQN